MGHRLIDHTADIGVEVEAGSREELFASMTEAFADCLTDPATVEERTERRFSVEAEDLESLAVEWLGELLYAFDVDRQLFRSAEVELEGSSALRLRATARGEAYDPSRHPIKVLIKGVTYHALEVRRRDGRWWGRIIFDV